MTAIHLFSFFLIPSQYFMQLFTILFYLNSTTLHHIFLLIPFLYLWILQAENKLHESK